MFGVPCDSPLSTPVVARFDSISLPCNGGTPCQRHFFSLPGSDSDLSKRYTERKLLGWSAQQLYDVVADVDQYHHFVPWCQKSVVLVQRENYLEAELEVGFRVFVERYTSKVTLTPPRVVQSEVGDSTLFTYLDSTWEFTPGPTPGSCWLTFTIDFEFKSPLYRQVAAVFFEEVVQRMMGAFQGRCQQVYGPSTLAGGKAKQACRVPVPGRHPMSA